SSALASAVPAEELRDSLISIRPMDMLTIALTARGTTYGAVTSAERDGGGLALAHHRPARRGRVRRGRRRVPRGLRAPGRGHPRHRPGAGRVTPGGGGALPRPHAPTAAGAGRGGVRDVLPGGVRAGGPRRRLLRRARWRRRVDRGDGRRLRQGRRGGRAD